MRATRSLELKVGLFLNLGFALLVIALVILGSQTSLLVARTHFHVALPNASGLLKGAKVMLAGVRVGTVDSFDLSARSRHVVIHFSIPRKYAELVRSDSTAEVLTEGVVGDRVVEITPGDRSRPAVPPEGEITYRPGPNINRLVGEGENLFKELTTLAHNLNTVVHGKDVTASLKSLNRVLSKIDRGSGSLSALINDPKLYDDLKAFVGEANENRVLRNLVRKAVEDAEKKRAPAGRK